MSLSAAIGSERLSPHRVEPRRYHCHLPCRRYCGRRCLPKHNGHYTCDAPLCKHINLRTCARCACALTVHPAGTILPCAITPTPWTRHSKESPRPAASTSSCRRCPAAPSMCCWKPRTSKSPAGALGAQIGGVQCIKLVSWARVLWAARTSRPSLGSPACRSSASPPGRPRRPRRWGEIRHRAVRRCARMARLPLHVTSSSVESIGKCRYAYGRTDHPTAR